MSVCKFKLYLTETTLNEPLSKYPRTSKQWPFFVSWELTLFTDGIFYQRILDRAFLKQNVEAEKKSEESFHIKMLHCFPILLFVGIEYIFDWTPIVPFVFMALSNPFLLLLITIGEDKVIFICHQQWTKEGKSNNNLNKKNKNITIADVSYMFFSIYL